MCFILLLIYLSLSDIIWFWYFVRCEVSSYYVNSLTTFAQNCDCYIYIHSSISFILHWFDIVLCKNSIIYRDIFQFMEFYVIPVIGHHKQCWFRHYYMCILVYLNWYFSKIYLELLTLRLEHIFFFFTCFWVDSYSWLSCPQ